MGILCNILQQTLNLCWRKWLQKTGGFTCAIHQNEGMVLFEWWWTDISALQILTSSWQKCYFFLSQAGYRSLKGFPRPFWLALFVEGTRFTQTKLAAAQEYAASVGMRVPRNVLIPRTKVGSNQWVLSVLVDVCEWVWEFEVPEVFYGFHSTPYDKDWELFTCP